jgi:hypothetical protein
MKGSDIIARALGYPVSSTLHAAQISRLLVREDQAQRERVNGAALRASIPHHSRAAQERERDTGETRAPLKSAPARLLYDILLPPTF